VNSEYVKDVGRSHDHSRQDESQDAFRKVKGCTVSNTLVDHIERRSQGLRISYKPLKILTGLGKSVLD
jgi:hypothetical protein